jgi:hypothetical protein
MILHDRLMLVVHSALFPGREYGGPSGGSMVLISLLNPTTRAYQRLSNTEWRPYVLLLHIFAILPAASDLVGCVL